MKYLRGFDGLRGLASLAVAFQHKLYFMLPADFELGKLSVEVFLCISGCLIFAILQAARERVSTGISTAGSEMRAFYIRRGLRIFPAYYLYCFGLAGTAILLQKPGLIEGFWYHISYLTNLWIAFSHPVFDGYFPHFWSLAAEEQFYVCFALLLLLLPRLDVRAVILLTLIGGPISLVLLQGAGYGYATLHTFPLISFAFIAAGACLTLKPPRIGVWGFGAGCLLLLLAHWHGQALFHVSIGPVSGELQSHLAALLGVYLIIGHLRTCQDSRIVDALECAPLRFLGRISYGIYVYHLLMPFRSVGGSLIPRLWGGEFSLGIGLALGTVLYLSGTLLIATLSYHLIEKPMLDLKHRLAGDSARNRPSTSQIS